MGKHYILETIIETELFLKQILKTIHFKFTKVNFKKDVIYLSIVLITYAHEYMINLEVPYLKNYRTCR